MYLLHEATEKKRHQKENLYVKFTRSENCQKKIKEILLSNVKTDLHQFLFLGKDCYVEYLNTNTCIPSTASYMTGMDDDLGKSDRAMMRQLPAEEREQIQMQVQEFLADKMKLDREVAKWDDSGNDIIVMAKQMCMIMMEMTDFTRQEITKTGEKKND